MSDAKITLSAEDKTRAAFAGVKANLLDVQASARALNASFGGLGALLGSAFAGVSLTAFVKATADGIDRLNDLKDATGASIENISALEDVAARTGQSFDSVATSLVKFNGVLKDTDGGNAAERIFQAIGLSVQELRRLDPAEALRQTAVALSQYADDGDKARAVQELFGKSLRDVAPFLNDLAEAGQLNAKVTAEQARQADAFNKQLAAMGKNSTDLARSLVSDLLPPLNSFLEKLGAINKSGGFFASIGKEFRLNFVSEQLRTVTADIESVQASIDRQGASPVLEKRMRSLRQEAAGLSKEAAEASAWLKRFAEAADPFVDPKLRAREDRGFVPDKPQIKVSEKPQTPTPDRSTIDDSTRALAQYVEQLQRQIDKSRELTEEQQATETLRGLGLKGDIPQVRELVLGLAREVDLRQRNAELAKLMAAETERQAKEQDDLDHALAEYSGRLEDARKIALTARLEQRLAAGDVFSPEELERMVKGIGGIKDELKTQLDEMDEFAKQAARNIQDALGDTLRDTLTGDFASIRDRWSRLLIDMATQAAAAQLNKYLFGDFGKTGNIGGLVGDGLKWLTLGAGKADGGPVGAHSLQRVNERGFEVFTDARGDDWLMTGYRGGRVTSHEQAIKGAGATGGAEAAVNIQQTLNFNGGSVSRQDLAAAMAQTRAASLAAFADLLKRRPAAQF